MDVNYRSRFMIGVAIACLAGCGGTPREPAHAIAVAEIDAGGGHLAELERPPAKKLVDVDWGAIHVGSEPEALALWQKIAPTGEDWEAKLGEIPSDQDVTRELAAALLRGGNFTCVAPPTGTCAKPPIDVEPPAPTATFADPCLRRILALWAIDQLDEPDLPRVHDALRAIAAIPPPESQLVAAAIKAVPEADLDGRLEILSIAWRAGQRELVNGMVGVLDEPHLIEAATKLHSDGALEVLSAEGHRAVYLGAVTDELMATAARAQAMVDLTATADTLAPDVHTKLRGALKSPDCTVAAAAARALDQRGDHQWIPKRPHARTVDPMMRATCVLASYEAHQRNDEASLLPGFLPSRGLELVKVVYDPYNEVDADGDGDPHTERTIDLIPRDTAVLPELEDLVRALRHCTGTICRSDDREFRFTFKPGSGGELVLWRLEVADLPPCSNHQAIPHR